MTDRWNPGATGVLGPEWFPSQVGSALIASNSDAVAIALQQTTPQAISALQFHIAGLPQRGGRFPVEVYDGETALAGATTTTVLYPNADISGGGALYTGYWSTQTGAATNLWSVVDESALDTSDFIYGFGSPPYYPALVPYRFRFTAPSFTGRRILRVGLVVWALSYYGGNLTAGLTIGGVDYVCPSINGVPLSGSNKAYTGVFTYNPATGLPWTIADLTLLNTTGGGYIAVSGGAYQYPFIYAINAPIVHCAENRLAVGVLDDTASVLTPGALNSVPLSTPTGGVWTKDGSGYHLYVVRRSSDVGQMMLQALDSGTVIPACRSYAVTLDPTYGQVTAMGAQSSRVFCIGQRTTAPADSIDSQPYWPGDYYGYVFTGYTAEMEFSGAAATTYGVCQVLVRPGLAGNATADLLIKLKKRSDNSQLGGTITITAAQVNAAPNQGNGWKLLTVRHTGVATLATANQYYREFSSTAVDVAHAWNVAAFYALSFQVAGFGGTTDRATFGGVEFSEYDAMGTIHTSALDPVPPTGVTATVVTVTIPETVLGVTTMQSVRVDWTQTSLGGSFSHTLLERSEDSGATWVPITQFNTEATATYRDDEPLLGVSSSYRLRTMNTEGVLSTPSSTPSATPQAVGGTHLLTSNFATAFNMAIQCQPNASFPSLDAANKVTTPIYGADNQIASQPTEVRGRAAHYTVTLTAAGDPTGHGNGPYAARALDAIANAPLPYVCIRDPDGSRIFASLAVGDISRSAGDLNIVPIVATPVTGPTLVVVS